MFLRAQLLSPMNRGRDPEIHTERLSMKEGAGRLMFSTLFCHWRARCPQPNPKPRRPHTSRPYVGGYGDNIPEERNDSFAGYDL